MESKCIDRTEMTFDTAEFFLKQHMIKSSIEFTITNGSRGDIFCVLTTTEENVLGAGTKIFYFTKYVQLKNVV